MRRLAALSAASLGAVFILLSTACSAPPDTHDADVKALKDTEAQWNQDYVAKDLDKITSHYADDSVLMVPGSPATSGKTAIRNVLKEMVSDPALALHFEASKVDVAKSGDLGYTQGAYTLAVTDPATKQVTHDHGSYVTIYRKQADGSWKAVSDIASSEVVPQAPAAVK